MDINNYREKLYESLSQEVAYLKEIDDKCFRILIFDRICHYLDLALDLGLIDYSTENILYNLIRLDDVVLLQATLTEW